jgi:hypothetical protein
MIELSVAIVQFFLHVAGTSGPECHHGASLPLGLLVATEFWSFLLSQAKHLLLAAIKAGRQALYLGEPPVLVAAFNESARGEFPFANKWLHSLVTL